MIQADAEVRDDPEPRRRIEEGGIDLRVRRDEQALEVLQRRQEFGARQVPFRGSDGYLAGLAQDREAFFMDAPRDEDLGSGHAGAT